MPVERYFVDSEIIEGQELYLEDPERHHLVNVMRNKVGDRIELVNGKGTLAYAQVENLEKKRVVIGIEKVSEEAPPKTEIILAQALPRMNRLDFIVEKGTELGMTQLWLFPAQHSERKEITNSQLERLNGICVSAMKQCGRLYLPKIVVKPPLTKWKSLDNPAFFGDINPQAPLLKDVWKERDHVIFFVGPESGFSDSEESKLREMNVVGVKLNDNILRTETAAIVALTLLTHRIR